jgi:hypothetical protein
VLDEVSDPVHVDVAFIDRMGKASDFLFRLYIFGREEECVPPVALGFSVCTTRACCCGTIRFRDVKQTSNFVLFEHNLLFAVQIHLISLRLFRVPAKLLAK